MSAYEDEQIARLALAENLIGAEAIVEARRLQKQYRALGIESKGLGEILLEEGHLSRYLLRSLYKKVEAPPAWPRIAGYEMLAKIAQGATGTVYQARQLSLDRVVAIKILSERLAEDPVYVERFEREARAAGRLSHPNVVGAIEVGECEGRRFLVMEYVEGRTVEEVLRERGTLEEREALDLATQVARALEHAHAAGFVHRDIKPANILVTPEGAAKLCDLGLVRPRVSERTLTRTGYTHGTPHYMSPEQALSDKAIDGRSDLYSLGATLYKMLTGVPPFGGDSAASILVQHIRSPLLPPSALRPGLTPAVDLLVRRLLAKDPRRRPLDASALLVDLSRIASGDVDTLVKELAPVVDRDEPAPAPRPRRLVLAASLALNLVLALGLAWRLATGTGEVGPSAPRPAEPVSPAVAAPDRARPARDRDAIERAQEAAEELSRLAEARRELFVDPVAVLEAYRTFVRGYLDLTRLASIAAGDLERVESELERAGRGALERARAEVGRALARGDYTAAVRSIDDLPAWLLAFDRDDLLGRARRRIADEGRSERARVFARAQALAEEGSLDEAARLLDRVLSDRRFATASKGFELLRRDVRSAAARREDAARFDRAERAYWDVYEAALVELAARRYERAIEVFEARLAEEVLAPVRERLQRDADDVRRVRARVFHAATDRLVASAPRMIEVRRRSGGVVSGVVTPRGEGEISIEKRLGERSHVITSLRIDDLAEEDLLHWAALDPSSPQDRLVRGLFRLFEGGAPEHARPDLEASGRLGLAAVACLREAALAVDSHRWMRASAALDRLRNPPLDSTSYARVRGEQADSLVERTAPEAAVESRLRQVLAGNLVMCGDGVVLVEYAFTTPAELADWCEHVQGGPGGPPTEAYWSVGPSGLRARAAARDRVLLHRIPFDSPVRIEVEWSIEDPADAGIDLYVAADESCARATVFRVLRPRPEFPLLARLFDFGGTMVQRELASFPPRLVATLSGGEQVLTPLGEPLRRRGLPAQPTGRLGFRLFSPTVRVTRLSIHARLAEGWDE